MPLPLKPGYNFHYSHIYRPAPFEMPAAEAYTNFYGICYMLRGDNLVYSPDGSKILHAGDISFTPKNIYFRSTSMSDKPRESILIKFTDSMVSDLIKVMEVEDFNELIIGWQQDFHLNGHLQEKILALFDEMEREWNSYNEYSELILKGLLHKLILILLTECSVKNKRRLQSTAPKRDDCLINAIEYIKAHLGESPSLQNTAEHIHISASYLSRVFINRLQTPYSVFVLNEKILYAQKLLVDSEMSMAEIARDAGFSSNAYFSDCFKRITGIAPSRFRKAYWQGE